MYVYENHLGGLYFSDTELDHHDLYCEQCGDSDWYAGEVYTLGQLEDLLNEYQFTEEYNRGLIQRWKNIMEEIEDETDI